MFRRPILISIAPNLQFADFQLALKLILSPKSWQKGNKIALLEKKLKEYFGKRYVFTFNSGRSALYFGLRALKLKTEDEVLIQAFTCVAVPNAVLWSGAKPVFVDIEKDSFNMDVADLKRKITPKAKAIIVQHTFGIPDKIEEIKRIAQEKNLFLIEDCAHSIGGKFKDKKLGTFGDLSIFSFGRDKAISSVFGGALITDNLRIAKRIKTLYSQLSFPKHWWILKQLLHPIFFTIAIPLYNFIKIGKFSLGKALIFLFQKLNLISLPVESGEKLTKQPDIYPKRLPNALAGLAIEQFKKLDDFNQKRRDMAAFYYQNLGFLVKKNKLNLSEGQLESNQPTFLRFPIKVKHPDKLISFAKKRAILLGGWYRPIVSPPGVDLTKVGYKKGTCPKAEKASRLIVNLPTHPRMNLEDAQRVVAILKEFFK